MNAPTRPYHHGDLRRALIDEGLRAIQTDGTAALNLRDLARRVGVSHAAPAHHFGDKTGLLTAIAAEGFGLLAADLRKAYEQTGSFLEVGVAYVGFALRRRAHFEIMFRPELLRDDNLELAEARQEAGAALHGPVNSVTLRPDEDARLAAIAGWALMHGLATLHLGGNLPSDIDADPEALARRIAVHLFVQG